MGNIPTGSAWCCVLRQLRSNPKLKNDNNPRGKSAEATFGGDCCVKRKIRLLFSFFSSILRLVKVLESVLVDYDTTALTKGMTECEKTGGYQLLCFNRVIYRNDFSRIGSFAGGNLAPGSAESK